VICCNFVVIFTRIHIKINFLVIFRTSCYIHNFPAIFARVATKPNFQDIFTLVVVNILYQLTKTLPKYYEKSLIKPNTYKLFIIVDNEAAVRVSFEKHLRMYDIM
jgi:hypothetical protein